MAGLAMYPFAELRPSYDQLWRSVAGQLPWVPEHLDWQMSLTEQRSHGELVLAQTCGWPLVTELAESVQVVGAFSLTIPEADGHRYRTTLVARADASAESLTGATAAINGRDSLSGWISLVAAVEGPGRRWSGDVVVTGAHLASLAAVRSGAADVASIDSVTLSHVRRWSPASVDGLVEIGHGPLVPSLPLITGPKTTPAQLAELRQALASAIIAEPAAAAALLIDGFVPLVLDDYLPLLALRPA